MMLRRGAAAASDMPLRLSFQRRTRAKAGIEQHAIQLAIASVGESLGLLVQRQAEWTWLRVGVSIVLQSKQEAG